MSANGTAWALDGVAVGYDGPPVVRIGQLAIEAGTVTAVVGANGAGKSTLLRLLALQALPQGGTLRFMGEPVTAARLAALRRRVGLLPQAPYLLRGSVSANVEIGLRLRRMSRAERATRVEAALASLGLARLAARPARELSGGEAQKVALARVLVFEPEVLVLDEPFTHLDAGVAAEIAALIARIGEARTQTVIFSTHDALRARALAGRVLGIVDGQLGAAALANVYAGRLDPALRVFDTGRLRLHVGGQMRAADRVAIDPARVTLSADGRDTGLRNCVAGRVVALVESGSDILVTVDAGEPVQALVSPAMLAQARLGIGSAVRASFPEDAVQAL